MPAANVYRPSPNQPILGTRVQAGGQGGIATQDKFNTLAGNSARPALPMQPQTNPAMYRGFDLSKIWGNVPTANRSLQDIQSHYEAQRKPGFAALGDPHGAAAQAYAAETNKNIGQILGDPQLSQQMKSIAYQQPIAGTQQAGIANWQKWANANPSSVAGTAKPPEVTAAYAKLAGGGYDHGPVAGGGPPARTQGAGPNMFRPAGNTLAGPQPAGGGMNPPGTEMTVQAGPGAGRGYPSNWNANNAPGYNYGDVAMSPENTGGTAAPGGASYETSPLYQWQLNQGEKNLNRQLRARGMYNSTFGLNTLADFYRGLGSQESERQYGRTVQQQQLGMQAAFQQAQQQQALAGMYGNYGNTLAGMSGNLGQYLSQLGLNRGLNQANLTGQYVRDVNGNIINLGQMLGQNAWNLGNPLAGNAIAAGTNRGDLYAGLGRAGGQILNMPWLQGGNQYPNGLPAVSPYQTPQDVSFGSDFGVTGYNPNTLANFGG